MGHEETTLPGRPLPPLPLPASPLPDVPVFPSFAPRTLSSEPAGVFATHDIPQGTRIIAEFPTVLLTGTQWIDSIVSQFHALSPALQKDYLSVQRKPVPELFSIEKHIDPWVPHVIESYYKPSEQRNDVESRCVTNLLPLVAKGCEKWCLASRFFSHCWRMTPAPESEWHTLGPGTPTRAFFLAITKFRHSCIPNCFATYNPAIGRLTVHTIRNVRRGQELFLSAIGGEVWYEDVPARPNKLDAMNLKCDCPVCDVYHSDFTKHDTLRRDACFRVLSLAHRLQSMSWYESPDARPPNIDPENIPMPTEQEDLEEAEQNILSLLKDLRDTGCEDKELVHWRKVLVLNIFSRMEGKGMPAVAHAMAAEKIADRCYGADHLETVEAKQMVEETKARLETERNAT